MNTPIYDFITEYKNNNMTRFHMPGHKGINFLGCEDRDITEINNADNLYDPQLNGIIYESEQNATEIFGTRKTSYSTGGSSQSISAMLYLVKLFNKNSNSILVGRNAHKVFIQSCGLLDIQPVWLYPENEDFQSICSCKITKESLKFKLNNMQELPMAVYITSPDYLGNIADIKGLSQVCNEYDIPLIVDNAHGAYLKFLQKSQHPMDLGADICCDSAHKTLPVLTGGGYIHISKNAKFEYEKEVKNAMALFGSTSPSYVIMQSLDLCNKYLSEKYKEELNTCVENIKKVKENLTRNNVLINKTEDLKIVIDCKTLKLYPDDITSELRKVNIEPEFVDKDCLVFMITPQNSNNELLKLENELKNIIDKIEKIRVYEEIISVITPKQVISIREALMSLGEDVLVENAVGRICRTPTLSCPPAIPVCVTGEIITEEHMKIFKYYGIMTVNVIK